MPRDLQHRLNPQPSILPGTVTATTNGASVDTLGYDSFSLLVQLAAIGGTAPSYAFKLQTSADGSTNWLDLDASAYIGGAAPAALTANGQLFIGVQSATGAGQSPLRYLRAVVTVTGTTPTAALFAEIILGYPRHSGVAV